MTAPRLLALFLVFLPSGVLGQVVCYHCFGNSSSSGQFCSIDRLCSGQSCYFNANPSGEWEAGCSSDNLASSSSVSCSQEGSSSICKCGEDFCNGFQDMNVTLFNNLWKDSSTQLFFPVAEEITCQECGNLTIGGLVRDIPCDERHLCLGNYCVTKRGQTPHSYCGSVWEGTNEGRCFKNPGEDEQCVCPQMMCNAVLPTEQTTTPATTISVATTLATLVTTVASTMETSTMTTTTTMTTPLITTETTTTTTEAPTTTTETTTTSTAATPAADPPATTSKPLTKKCKTNIKFSPNAQAVFMGEKLKQVITGGFGTDGKALQEFQDGIDTHICVYE